MEKQQEGNNKNKNNNNSDHNNNNNDHVNDDVNDDDDDDYYADIGFMFEGNQPVKLVRYEWPIYNYKNNTVVDDNINNENCDGNNDDNNNNNDNITTTTTDGDDNLVENNTTATTNAATTTTNNKNNAGAGAAVVSKRSNSDNNTNTTIQRMIRVALHTIDDIPGAVQSGHYLWPGANYLADYLISQQQQQSQLQPAENNETNIIGIIELGSGCGLVSLVALQLYSPTIQCIVLTDHDPGTLIRANDNYEITIQSIMDSCIPRKIIQNTTKKNKQINNNNNNNSSSEEVIKKETTTNLDNYDHDDEEKEDDYIITSSQQPNEESNDDKNKNLNEPNQQKPLSIEEAANNNTTNTNNNTNKIDRNIDRNVVNDDDVDDDEYITDDDNDSNLNFVINTVSSIPVLFESLEWGNDIDIHKVGNQLFEHIIINNNTICKQRQQQHEQEQEQEQQCFLLLGSDLIYCVDVVRSLFYTIYQLIQYIQLQSQPYYRIKFLLSQSFIYDTAIEDAITNSCNEFHFHRTILIDTTTATNNNNNNNNNNNDNDKTYKRIQEFIPRLE